MRTAPPPPVYEPVIGELPKPGDHLVIWREDPDDRETCVRFLRINAPTAYVVMCEAKDIYGLKDRQIHQVWDLFRGRLVFGKRP